MPRDDLIAGAVRNHYLAHWGHNEGIVMRSANTEVVIHEWPPDVVRKGVVAYSTSGTLDGPRTGHLREFIVLLTDSRSGIARSLADLWVTGATASVGHGTTVGHGDPLWTGTEMCNYLVTSQESLLQSLAIDHETHVTFHRAIPVYDSEVEVKRQNGLDALLAVWREARVPFWDPARADPLRP
jgi:Suppressor of fused protein (SUFU)